MDGAAARGWDTVLSGAGAILSERRGRSVALTDARVVSDRPRSLVVRCRAGPPLGGADRVVVKWFKPGHALGFVEWASLAYLSGLPDARSLIAALECGDPVRGILVLEDLGDGRSLDDLLMGATPRPRGWRSGGSR